MTKIDVGKHIEQAEGYVEKLYDAVTDENALTETLTNLVDALKPFASDSLNYKIFCAAVSEIRNFNDAENSDTNTKKKKTSKIGAIVDFFQSIKLNSAYKENANSSKDNIDEKELNDEKADSNPENPEQKSEPNEPRDDLKLEKKKLAVKTLSYLFNCIKNEFDVEDKNSKPQIIVTSDPEIDQKSVESE